MRISPILAPNFQKHSFPQQWVYYPFRFKERIAMFLKELPKMIVKKLIVIKKTPGLEEFTQDPVINSFLRKGPLYTIHI